MKSKTWICLIVLVALAVVPALAGSECSGKKAAAAAKTASHSHECTADTQFCLNKMATKLKNKGWVGIELDVNEETGAMTVARVEYDSPAQSAGMREGDVLLALNGIRFDSEDKEQLHAAKKQMTIGSRVSYTVERKGREKNVDVTLAAVPEDVMAKWVGQHMLGHATIELASN
jgi:predicted metalloprotease with PDZ domain